MKKIAVVLFNLGGPDGPEAVRPFLFNLFNDRAIIDLPMIFRWPLARLISKRRAPIAKAIYAEMGGGSPLLPNTEVQAQALEAMLNASLGREEGSESAEWRCFIAMRYWTPRSDGTAAEVSAFKPDVVVLLPLYPQYSTTTIGSSVADWHRAAARAGVLATTRTLCCYPNETGFIDALAARAGEALRAAGNPDNVRVLYSAHGLPKKIVAAGDPYQWQVERTAESVTQRLAELDADWQSLDSVVCYQSRVGPLEWIGPSTDDEIRRAGAEGLGLVVVPVAFVSEHSETLVELDIEYAALAKAHGVPSYHRAATVDDQPDFIAGLARLARAAVESPDEVCSQRGGRICPQSFARCRHRLAA